MCLSFSSIRVLIFLASKCPEIFDCYYCSLILDCKEPVISDKCLKSSLGFPTGRQRSPTSTDIYNELDWNEITHILRLYGNDPWA